MTNDYQQRIARLGAQYGERADASELNSRPDLIHWYNRGWRVRVVNTFGYERTGIVATTTGWRPGWILKHRVSDHGSSDVLMPHDVVTHFKPDGGRRYVPVANDSSAPNYHAPIDTPTAL